MIEVWVGSLIIGLIIAVTDKDVALLYTICAVQCQTLSQWAILTFAGMVYYVYHVVANAIKG